MYVPMNHYQKNKALGIPNIECKICKKKFRVILSRLYTTKYCSKICYGKSRAITEENRLAKRRERQAKWVQNNREKQRSYGRTSYWKNRQKNIDKTYKWREKNREKFLRYSREYAQSSRYKLRQEIFKKYGSKCKKCGFSDLRALQIDHVDGGGTQEFKKVFNSRRADFLKAVLKDTKNQYQILCANCNFIKRYENNELKKTLKSISQ